MNQDKGTHQISEKLKGLKFRPLHTAISGFFMGLANLVPGVSGGTMVLAMGVYDDFIAAFSGLTRLKFTKKSLLFLGVLFTCSFVTIFTFSGIIQYLMEIYRPEMLAWFIGLTLGGVPILYGAIKPINFKVGSFLFLGFLMMAYVAFFLEPGSVIQTPFVFLLAGMIGSSAMILPGISGNYLLLIMGLYLPIIAGLNDFKFALGQADWTGAFQTALEILGPFGIGLILGIGLFSNFLNYLLSKQRKMTEGFLLGILLGSVLGLYPFKTMPLEKMTKYAVSTQEGSVLKVALYSKDDNPVLKSDILALQHFNVKVQLEQRSGPVTLEEMIQARQDQTVILVYDQQIPPQVRREAMNKEKGKVSFQVLANTTLTPIRALICLLTMFFGLFITIALGRLEGKQGQIKQNEGEVLCS